MKRTDITFAEGFLGIQAKQAQERGAMRKAFDWGKAAQIIKDEFQKHSDLIAEAGLQGDWAHTGGEIFRNGHAIKSEYTYLASNWATPALILSWDGKEQMEIECFIEENERFNSDTKWDDKSLEILGLPLLVESEE